MSVHRIGAITDEGITRERYHKMWVRMGLLWVLVGGVRGKGTFWQGRACSVGVLLALVSTNKLIQKNDSCF